MHYELNDHEWAAIKPMLPNKPRGVPRAVFEWHLLGFTIWCPVARPAGQLWSVHHLLQSLHALAMSGRLGQDHERTGRCS
jgi:transposase